MTLEKYVELAQVTSADKDNAELWERMSAAMHTSNFVSLIISAREVGEALNEFKRFIYYGNAPKDMNRLDDFCGIVVHAKETCSRLHEKFTEGTLYSPGLEFEGIEESLRFATMLHGIIGVATENSELISAIAVIPHENALPIIPAEVVDTVNIEEEIGDLMWYMAEMFSVCKSSPSEIASRNISKLEARYGAKFDAHREKNRDLAKERGVLEGEPKTKEIEVCSDTLKEELYRVKQHLLDARELLSSIVETSTAYDNLEKNIRNFLTTVKEVHN